MVDNRTKRSVAGLKNLIAIVIVVCNERATGSAAPACPWNCSLGGECVDGKCECDATFAGDSCGSLALAPNRSSRALFYGNMSSWGGSVLSIGGKFYMYAAVMANGCGLNTWTCNSQCNVAVADTAVGPYKIVDGPPIVGPFCHNPTAHLAPDGTIVIFHIGRGLYHDGIPPMVCKSGNGTTDPSFSPSMICKKPNAISPPGAEVDCFSSDQFSAGDPLPSDQVPDIVWANVSSPLGPFTPLRDPQKSSAWDANNAALHIFPNGTVLLVAKFGCNSTIVPGPAMNLLTRALMHML